MTEEDIECRKLGYKGDAAYKKIQEQSRRIMGM